MAVTSLLIGAYAVLLLPAALPCTRGGRRVRFPQCPRAKDHITASGIALITGPFPQFLRPLRHRFPVVHRTIGRIHVVACLIGGLASGLIALFSTSGQWRIGFLSLAIAGFSVRPGLAGGPPLDDYLIHQRWMIRSFASAFAAVMLRIYVPLSQIAGWDYADSYRVIAWLSWCPTCCGPAAEPIRAGPSRLRAFRNVRLDRQDI